jgi:hypothetical protein
MANAYSILHNYDQPVYEPNLDLVAKVLSYKQQKLNAGRQKVQSMYDQFSMLDFQNDVDKEYAEERLGQVKNMLDRHASGDLSSDAVLRDVVGNLDNFVDDNIITAAVSTKKFKSDLSTWADKRENDPDKFAPQNYNFAMKRARAYTESQKVGQQYKGEAAFIEYVNIPKLLNDNAIEIAKSLEVDYVEDKDGGYSFREKVSGKKVDPHKLESALRGLLTDQKVRMQMTIDSDAIYGNYSDEDLQDEYANSQHQKTSFYSGEVSKIERYLESNPDLAEDKKNEQLENKKMYEAKIASINDGTEFKSILEKNGRSGVMTKMYSDRLIGRTVSAYSKKGISDIEVNEADKYYMEYSLRAQEQERKNKETALKLNQATADASKTAEADAAFGTTGLTGSSTLTEAEGFVKDGETGMAMMQSDRNSSTEGFESLLKGKGYSQDVIDKLKETAFASNFKNIAGKSSVTVIVDGKPQKVEFDQELRQAALSYTSAMKRAKPYDAVVEESYISAKNELTKSLAGYFKKENWEDATYLDYKPHLPMLSGKLVEQDDGSLTFVGGTDDSLISAASSNEDIVAIFNKKGSLTKAEQATKELYISGIMASDIGIPEDERQEYKRIHRDNLKKYNVEGDIELVYWEHRKQAITGGTMPQFLTNLIEPPNSFYSHKPTGEHSEGVGDRNIFFPSEVSYSKTETGSISWDRDIDVKPISEIYSGASKELDAKVTKMFEDGELVPDPKRYTYDGGSDEVKKLESLVAGEGSAQSIDVNEPMTVLPQYSGEEKAVTGYKIKHYVKATGTDGLTEVTSDLISSDIVENVLPIGSSNKPILNPNIKGQKVFLGNFETYTGQGSFLRDGSSQYTPGIMQNLNGIKGTIGVTEARLDEAAESYGMTEEAVMEDKARLKSIKDKWVNGQLNFELVTLGQGKYGVEIQDQTNGSVLYTATTNKDKPMVSERAATLRNMSDPTIKTQIMYNALSTYLTNEFYYSTNAYKAAAVNTIKKY